jgi:hypothetical protein
MYFRLQYRQNIKSNFCFPGVYIEHTTYTAPTTKVTYTTNTVYTNKNAYTHLYHLYHQDHLYHRNGSDKHGHFCFVEYCYSMVHFILFRSLISYSTYDTHTYVVPIICSCLLQIFYLVVRFFSIYFVMFFIDVSRKNDHAFFELSRHRFQ